MHGILHFPRAWSIAGAVRVLGELVIIVFFSEICKQAASLQPLDFFSPVSLPSDRLCRGPCSAEASSYHISPGG